VINTPTEALDSVIDTFMKLGRKQPKVNKSLGKVSGFIKKGHFPWRMCIAEVTVLPSYEGSSIFIAVQCEEDSIDSRIFSNIALRQVASWLFGSKGLDLLEA
jgi:hypothetical protein